MKCSGTMANLFKTRMCSGGETASVISMAGAGLSKGSKKRAGFWVVVVAGFGTGALGLLAKEGEKRSWNCARLHLVSMVHQNDRSCAQRRERVESDRGAYRNGIDVEEGDLGRVEIDVAAVACPAKGIAHELG